MGYLHNCLMCGEKIDSDLLKCPYCGERQYGENNEFYPDNKAIKTAKTLFKGEAKTRKAKSPMFSEEECLLYGIHPDDELYRKTMELDILSKNYKK